MPTPVLVCLLRHGADDALLDVTASLPATVHGQPVQGLVVHAGGFVGELPGHGRVDALGLRDGSGLGSLARAALAAGADRHAVVTVLLDPSGEYDVADLPDLLAPLFDGDADYVVGSRFARGRPRAMTRRRHLGNRLLTAWVRRNTRLPVTDGQSGFRAFSASAAAAAEVVHDFNHTQVVTLDLVAKGFRYREVPVSYSARPSGASWVRPLPYLRQVRRGVRTQLRTTSAVTAFGPPIDRSADPSDLMSPEPIIDLRDGTLAGDGPRTTVGGRPMVLPRPGDRTASLSR